MSANVSASSLEYNNGENYAKGYYGSYRSAFKKIFSWQKRSVPDEYDVAISDIIKGISRQETLDVKTGRKVSGQGGKKFFEKGTSVRA